MNFYKVIQNNTVIDVGFMYMKWYERHCCMIYCDISEAQFIQSSDQTKIWRVQWLNPAPKEAGEYEVVDAVEISEEEYNDLYKKLELGEKVTVEPDRSNDAVSEEETEQAPPVPLETVMDPAEQRRRIIALEKQLSDQKARNDFLEECILELSEIVYDG